MRLLVLLALAFAVGLNSHAAADDWGMSTTTTANNAQGQTTTQTPTATTATPTATTSYSNNGASEATTANSQNTNTPTATYSAATVSPGNATSTEGSSSSSANTVSTSSSTNTSSGSMSMVLGLVGVMGAVLAVSMFINARIRKKREQRASDEAKHPPPGQSAQYEPYSGFLSPSRVAEQQSSNSTAPQHEVIDIQQHQQVQEKEEAPSAFIPAPNAAFVDVTAQAFVAGPTPNIHAPTTSQTPIPEYAQLFPAAPAIPVQQQPASASNTAPVFRGIQQAPAPQQAPATEVRKTIPSAPEFEDMDHSGPSAPEFDDFERGSGSNEVTL